MGEVYRARDTRLGRDVAIKVLPERFISSPDFRQRFEREARAISSLQHPHICVLYDVGHDDAAGEYLVMEYLEGESGFSGEAKLTLVWPVEAPRTENSTGPSIQRRSGVCYRLAGESNWKFQLRGAEDA